MSEPVRTRLADSDDPMAKVLAKATEGGALARPGSRERVWAQMAQPKRAQLGWAAGFATAAAVAAAVAFVVLRPAVPERATIIFSSSTDAHAGDQVSVLSVSAHGRAQVQLGTARLVLNDSTLASFSTGAVLLNEGSLTAQVHTPLRVFARAVTIDTEEAVLSIAVAGETVELYVDEGEARVAGLAVHAKQSWSSVDGLGEKRRAVAVPAPGGEALLHVAKPVGARVSLDGVELGIAPLEVMVSAGVHELTAVEGARHSTLSTTVAAQGGTVEVPEPPLPPLPEITFEKPEPEPTPEVHPARVEPPADPAKRYLVARTLAQHGRYTEALGIYEGLSRGKSGWAEPSLYEVGRLQLRALKNAAAAETAFAEYRTLYPHGSLSHEVALSEIEVQLKLGAGEGALRAMDDFLAAFPSSERRLDVRFVRATVRRDRGDCAGAAADYFTLVHDPSHADDALYFAAVCEQQMGADAVARVHLAEYLRRFPSGAHAADVRRFFEGGRAPGNSQP